MLDINNLEVEVQGKKILKGISLRLKPGEIHVLMGPNGAGKTSLVMATMGKPEYKITGGQILLDGKNIIKLTPDERACLGLFASFQKPPEIPGVTVRNLLGRLVKDDLEEKIAQALTDLPISEELLTRALNEQFSGGEVKKMELFQAKILQPKFLILDEIDSGLDIDSLQRVVENIRKMSRSAILLITHNPRLLKFIKPVRLHILIKGTIVRSDGPTLASEIEKKGYQWLTKS